MSTPLNLSSGCEQFIGKRENQEDFAHPHILVADGAFALMADGMGGHEQGEVASREAAGFFDAAMAKGYSLEQAARAANEGLRQLKEAGRLAPGAGCTLTAVKIDTAGRLSFVSVGDSYILYCPASGGIHQLNTLHTRGAELDEMAARGEITREEAATADKRHALISAITGKPLKRIDVDVVERNLSSGDRILLLSDGFLPLGHAKLANLLATLPPTTHPKTVAKAIINAVRAIDAPKQDNVTAVCVQLNAPGEKLDEPAGLPTPAAKTVAGEDNSSSRLQMLLFGGCLLLACAIGLVAAPLLQGGSNPPATASNNKQQQPKPTTKKHKSQSKEQKELQDLIDEAEAIVPDDLTEKWGAALIKAAVSHLVGQIEDVQKKVVSQDKATIEDLKAKVKRGLLISGC